MPQEHDLDTMEGVLDSISDAGDGARVAVADIVEEIGDDAFGPLMRRTIERKKLDTGRDWLMKPARFLDRITRKRLTFLVRAPFDVVPAAICMMCGAVMPLLEFVPFSGSIAAGAVALFALAFVTEDGLLSVLASGLVGGLVYLVAVTAM